MLAAEIIRTKRDGLALSEAQIGAFVQGLVDGGWSEGQVAALAMAILLRGMSPEEGVALTRAMTHSGEVLQWQALGRSGPVLDKHSTGGVGDKVSLMLAPMLAACGAVVPMISGRGLGHTGGTLDKLQALPGYCIDPPREQLLGVLRDCGCAIVGAGTNLAPADRRLYAVRDVTATVESVPLITASILSKKLAAGLQGLVLDVKWGNGAFMASRDEAGTLARNLVRVASGLGLPATALVTDMNQVLGTTAGNALETQEAIDFLTGASREPRLLALTLALAAHALLLGGLAKDLAAATAQAELTLSSGRAAEAFARMVADLGGPRDVLAAGGSAMPIAPVQRDLLAPGDGFIAATDTRALGLAVVALGGGRQRAADAVDPRVGFSHIRPLGQWVRAGEPLLRVHAAGVDAAEAAMRSAAAAITIGPSAPPSLALIDRIMLA
ncbi:MAG: thymidine phosphorylase [Ideonella sp.]|nr:thymidine phosphorylase [Ideonella sp.]